MSIKFSLIVPCFNASKLINNLTKKIVNCKTKPDELIFVNDCSTDNTLDLLNKINLKKIKKVIINTPRNLGPGGARNLGVKNSINDYILFLDSDIEISENLFEIFVEKIQKYDVVVGIYHFKSLNNGFFQNIKSYYFYFLLFKNSEYLYSVFSASCAGIKKSIFYKVGGFDDWFGLNKIDYENEDLGKRLKKITNIWLVPSMQIYHYFPNNYKLFKTLILRTSHWMEDFLVDKKKTFNEEGDTKQTAIKSLFSALTVFLLIVLTVFHNKILLFFLLISLLVDIYFNYDFLNFIKKNNKSRISFFLGLILFDTLIVIGAILGCLKVFFGLSKFQKKNV